MNFKPSTLAGLIFGVLAIIGLAYFVAKGSVYAEPKAPHVMVGVVKELFCDLIQRYLQHDCLQRVNKKFLVCVMYNLYIVFQQTNNLVNSGNVVWSYLGFQRYKQMLNYLLYF